MIDPHNRPVLSDGIVTLRAPRDGDVEARFAMGLSDDILSGFALTIAEMPPFTMDQVAKTMGRMMDSPYAFLIDYNDALTGEIFLHSVDTKDQRAEVAVGLHDPERLGQGIGTRAMRLLMAHAFDTMGLNRIGLRYLDGNARAGACYAKLGFVEEGRLRERARINGVFKDDIQMSCLAREFIR